VLSACKSHAHSLVLSVDPRKVHTNMAQYASKYREAVFVVYVSALGRRSTACHSLLSFTSTQFNSRLVVFQVLPAALTMIPLVTMAESTDKQHTMELQTHNELNEVNPQTYETSSNDTSKPQQGQPSNGPQLSYQQPYPNTIGRSPMPLSAVATNSVPVRFSDCNHIATTTIDFECGSCTG
jgi:predicted Rossmann fold nucleotide-binding protein DprA/Smf involved in DNA uptake